MSERIQDLAQGYNGAREVVFVAYDDLPTGSSDLDDEIFTYALSVPRLSFYVLDRAKPIIRYLRHHHHVHHNQRLMRDWNFNVTFPIADHLLRTAYKKDDALD